jgi:positive regulator of sigma E activity
MESVSDIFRPVSRADAVVYISQVLLLFIVVITSLVNLSMSHGNTNLWTMVLTSCLGYMLPHPRLKTREREANKESDGVVLRDFALQRDQQQSQ